jgi:LytS/YehU family sensor histidine kinase
MLFAVGIELLHAGLALALIRPFTEALDIVYTAIPGMIIAVSLGVGISIIIIHSVKESCRAVCSE